MFNNRLVHFDLHIHIYGPVGFISSPKMAKNQRFSSEMAAQGPKRTIRTSLTSKKCGPGDPCHILIDIFQYVHSTGSVGV